MLCRNILNFYIQGAKVAFMYTSFLNDEPIQLSEKSLKHVLLLKFLLLPFFIKIKSKLDDNIGNSDAGYHVECSVGSRGGD